jgi:hypothetical protein
MNEGQQSDQIHILPIEPPPMLAETLGYGGQARRVAFYWGSGDEAYYQDGYLSTQAEWDAYLLFVRHPLVAPHLQRYHLGSSEEEATHWLLLDREAQQIAIAPTNIARQMLMAQWGRPTSEQIRVVLDKEAWDQLVAEAVASIERISQEQIFAHMFEHQRRIQELASWLEMKWSKQRLHEQQPANNRLILADIEALATQLEFDFAGSPQEYWFDLDKRGNSSQGGTFRNDEAGIREAYGYLVRYQHTLEQLDQVRGQ